MCQTSLEMILAEDYLKYMKYANIPKEHNMSYLRPKGIYLVNYIEQLFLRLFDEDIDEFIDTNNLRGTEKCTYDIDEFIELVYRELEE